MSAIREDSQSDIRRQLNPSQFSAVTAIDGPLLVIAGAGSGKTRVIEFRVRHLVEQKISPHAILLLSFTRSAAREMISRAARHDPRCRNVEGGTFHSFSYKQLKKFSKYLGFTSSFTVLDEGDAEEAIHRCAVKMGLREKEKRYPKKDTMRSIISMSTNKDMTVSEILKKEYPHFAEYAPQLESLRMEYAAYKIRKNYMDYDDLLVYMKILLENGEMGERLAQQYRYVMVDEYQDTNRIQGDIAFLLSKNHRNIMVVGDDAQSIYGFRGASHENIMKFPDSFPECSIVKLEENYRSTQAILDVANAVLENMKNKYSKCLVSARKVTGEKPLLSFHKDAYEEAEWIADAIREKHDQGISFSHQCVLFRSQYLSIPLQAELSKRNIPYNVFGGMKFYETAHVKDVIAHLRVVANLRDELSWNRILMLIGGIGPKTADRISDEVLTCATFEEIIKKVLDKHGKGHKYSEGLCGLSSLFAAVGKQDTPVGDLYSSVLEYYEPIMRDKFDDWHLRRNDLEALRQIATKYASLEDLLEDFAVEPPEKGVLRVEPSANEDETPLTLSTIHSAKGLEWEAVFIIGLMDGVLPVAFSLDNEDEIEEEQRLFYVAVTRAKRFLTLSLHHEGFRGGLYQFNKISRFIDVPNVMNKLSAPGSHDQRPRVRKTTVTEGIRIYDKESLIQKVHELMQKKTGNDTSDRN